MAVVVGLTGGIATGKSTVLAMFAELGAEVVSADVIGREVIAKGTPAYQEIIDRFGSGIIKEDGEIDRPALAEVIFSDPDARKALEEITHPRIIFETQRRIDHFRATRKFQGAVLVVEIPLLIECGLQHIVDKVVLVVAEQETQIDRLTTRSGISREEALRRIGSQMPLEAKKEYADWIIENNGTLQALRCSVRSVWEQISLL